MTAKQEVLISELLKGSSVTDACRCAKITTQTFYNWQKDKTFTDELKSRKQAILNDCTMYLRSKFKTASETLVSIIESADTSAQIKINAIDSFMRTYKTVAEEDCVSRLEELETRLKELEGGEGNETNHTETIGTVCREDEFTISANCPS